MNGFHYIQQPVAKPGKGLPAEIWGSTELVQSFEHIVVGAITVKERPAQSDWISFEQNLMGVFAPSTLFPHRIEEQFAPAIQVRITEPKWARFETEIDVRLTEPNWAQVEQNLTGVSVPTTSYQHALERLWEGATIVRLVEPKYWAHNLTGVSLPTKKLSQYALAKWWEAGTNVQLDEANWGYVDQNVHLEQLIPKVSPSSVLEALQDAYVIVGRDEVASLIDQNQLAGILKEAREPLVAAFGQATVKTLTVVEDEEGARTLFCLVMYQGDMQEARKALKAFDRNWWLQRSKRFASKLNFDFELI